MQTFLQFLEEDTRRDFLKKLGMGVSGIASGINPLKGMSSDDEEYDPSEDYYEDYFDVFDWINSNVLDHTVDRAIGDTKISKELANEIWKKLISNMDERAGDSLTVELMTMFDDLMVRETSQGKRFYEVLEDPEFLEIAISNLSEMINDDLKLPQIIAKAAAREAMGHKQEDIMKDVKAELNDPNRVQADPNQIKYSKFDTAGGTREYEYTADSYKSFDSLCESFMENIDKEAEREKIRKIFLTDYGDNNPTNRELTLRTIKQYGIDAFMDAFYIKNRSKFRREVAKLMDLKQGRRDVFSDDDKIRILQMFVPAGERRKISNPNSSLNGQVIIGTQVGGYDPSHTLTAAEIARVIKNNPEWHLKRELTANEARFIKQVSDKTISEIIKDAGMSVERGRRGEL